MLNSLPSNSSVFVYAILVDGVVRYIGKGRGNRPQYHIWAAERLNARRANSEKVKALKFHNHLAKALRNGAIVKVKILKRFDTDEAAFSEEIKQIAKRDGLWNEQEGGQGLTSAVARRITRKMWRDPDFQPGKHIGDPVHMKKMVQARLDNPSAVEKFKESMQPFWASKKFKRLVRANGIMIAEKYRDEKSLRMTETMSKPENKAAIAAGNKKRMQDPEQRAKTLAILAAARDRHNKDPAFQAKAKAGLQVYWEKRRLEKSNV